MRFAVVGRTERVQLARVERLPPRARLPTRWTYGRRRPPRRGPFPAACCRSSCAAKVHVAIRRQLPADRRNALIAAATRIRSAIG